MALQTGLNPAMRTILVDWVVEVHKRFKLVQESLYLTVHILDLFLAIQPISRSKLQLAGLGCLLVASKYEDTWPPRIADLIFIADKAYTREEIIGRPSSDFISERDLETWMRNMEDRDAPDSYELTWRSKDGTPIYTIVSPRAMHDSQGRFIGGFGVITDITALSHANSTGIKTF